MCVPSDQSLISTSTSVYAFACICATSIFCLALWVSDLRMKSGNGQRFREVWVVLGGFRFLVGNYLVFLKLGFNTLTELIERPLLLE